MTITRKDLTATLTTRRTRTRSREMHGTDDIADCRSSRCPTQAGQVIRAHRAFVLGAGWEVGTEDFNLVYGMLVSGVVGPSAERVARVTGIPRSTARLLSRRARANGIWTGRHIEANEGWEDSMAIILDGLCVTGIVESA